MTSPDWRGSRRDLLRAAIRLGILGSVTAAGVGCSSRLSCDDLSALSTAQVLGREAVHYSGASPHGPEKNCTRCVFFKAGPEGACGGCKLVAGPINPGGYCDSWATGGAPARRTTS